MSFDGSMTFPMGYAVGTVASLDDKPTAANSSQPAQGVPTGTASGTFTLTQSSTGEYTLGDKVKPPTIGVIFWKRTA